MNLIGRGKQSLGGDYELGCKTTRTGASAARARHRNATELRAPRAAPGAVAHRFPRRTAPKMLAPSHFIGFGDLTGDRKADARSRPTGATASRAATSSLRAAPSTATRAALVHRAAARLHSSTQVKGGPPAYAHLMGNPCEWSLMSCDRGPSQAAKGFRSPVGWQRGLHPDVADKLYEASL